MIYDGNSFRIKEYKAWAETAELGDTLCLNASDNLELCQRVAIYRDTFGHYVNIKVMNTIINDRPLAVVDITYNGPNKNVKQTMLTRYLEQETHEA